MRRALDEAEHDDLFADKHTGTGESADSPMISDSLMILTMTGPVALPEPDPEQPVVLL